MATSKYTTEQFEQAKKMFALGLKHDEIVATTGVDKSTLIVWKSRFKSANKSTGDNSQTEAQNILLQEVERLKAIIETLEAAIADAKIKNVESENEKTSFEETIKKLNDSVAALNAKIQESENIVIEKTAIETFSLPIALMLLHISAIYGVANVLEILLHSKVMGILTAIVICSSALVIFASKKQHNNLAIYTILSVFMIEFVCNLITIQSKMNCDIYNTLKLIGCEPFYIFLVFSFLLPALNLKLEVILFEE